MSNQEPDVFTMMDADLAEIEAIEAARRTEPVLSPWPTIEEETAFLRRHGYERRAAEYEGLRVTATERYAAQRAEALARVDEEEKRVDADLAKQEFIDREGWA
jgi:hypothetical protein